MTQWELVESSSEVGRDSNDVVKSSLRTYQKFARRMLEVRWEFTEGNRELTRGSSEGYQGFAEETIEQRRLFGSKVTDDQILKCDQRCPWVKLLQQDQEILANFFLLLLDDYEAMLDIKWLIMLGDVP
ncbi:hypothetical protein BHE74_00019190 [Ensete ventricosum]|nr:hypothetical protein BHE74_00019190 [Ensete ventricosum]